MTKNFAVILVGLFLLTGCPGGADEASRQIPNEGTGSGGSLPKPASPQPSQPDPTSPPNDSDKDLDDTIDDEATDDESVDDSEDNQKTEKKKGFTKFVRLIRNDFLNSTSATDNSTYEENGIWEDSSLLGHDSTKSRYSRDPSAVATYTTNLIPGRYCLKVYRVTHPNSANKFLYSVYQSNKKKPVFEEIILDHSQDTSQSGWTALGVYKFKKKPEVTLQIRRHPDSNAGVLRADDIVFERIKKGYDCHGKMIMNAKKGAVIDNLKDEKFPNSSEDTDGYREFGEWKQSSLAGFDESISRYSGDPQAFATYTASVKKGNYCIQVYQVMHPNSIDRARVSLKDAKTGETIDTITLDHREQYSNSTWVSMGTYNFKKKKTIQLMLERDPNGDNGGYLRADAVKISKGACFGMDLLIMVAFR